MNKSTEMIALRAKVKKVIKEFEMVLYRHEQLCQQSDMLKNLWSNKKHIDNIALEERVEAIVYEVTAYIKDVDLMLPYMGNKLRALEKILPKDMK